MSKMWSLINISFQNVGQLTQQIIYNMPLGGIDELLLLQYNIMMKYILY